MVKAEHNTGRKRVVKRPPRASNAHRRRPNRGSLHPRTLPPADPPPPEVGQFPAVRTDDGAVYWQKDWSGSTHAGLAREKGIPPERVVGGGWIVDGDYRETESSDSGRLGERGRAAMRTGRYLDLRSNPVTDWVMGPYAEFSSAMEKAQRLQGQGHHIRHTEPEYGKHTGLNREWWIHGYSYGDIPEGARLGSRAGSRVNPHQVSRVTFDDLTPEQQQQAFVEYRADTHDTDSDEIVKAAVFYGFDWDSLTGRPWSEENPRLSVKMDGMEAVFESDGEGSVAVAAPEVEEPVSEYTGEGYSFQLVPLKQLVPVLEPGEVENKEYAEEIAKSMRTSGWSGRPLLGMVMSEPGEELRVQLITGAHRYYALMRLWESGEWPGNLPTVMVPVHLMRKEEMTEKLWKNWWDGDWYEMKKLAEAGKGPEEAVRLMRAERNPNLLRKIDAYLFPPSISMEPIKGAKQYKGIWIYPSALGFSTSIEPESYFDSRKDAEKFVIAWLSRKGNPALDPDKHYVLVFKTKSGDKTQTLAYKGSDQRGIEKALKHIEEKYEVPKSEVLFEEKKSNPHSQGRDYANYFTMPASTDEDENHARFVEELLRKWGYATMFKYWESKGGRKAYMFYTDAGRKAFMKAAHAYNRKENPVTGAHGPHSEITMYSPNEGDTTAYGRDIYTGAWHVLYGGRSVKEIEDFIERNKFQRPGHRNEWVVSWLESEHGEGVYSPVQIYERQGGVNRVVKTWPNGAEKAANPRSSLEKELKQVLVYGTYRLYGLHGYGWGLEETAFYDTAPARFARIIEKKQQQDVRMREPVTQFKITSFQPMGTGSLGQDVETVWSSQPQGQGNPRSRKHLSYRVYLQSPEAQQILQIRAPGVHESIQDDYQRLIEAARLRRELKTYMRHGDEVLYERGKPIPLPEENPVVLGPRIEEQAHEAGREIGQHYVARPRRLTEYLVLESFKDWARRIGLMGDSAPFNRPLYSKFRVGALEAVGAGASRNPRRRRRTR